TVNGTNFTNTMSILINGNPVSTTFVNSGQLIANVTGLTGSSALVSVATLDNYVTPATRITLGTLQITTTSLPPATGLQPYDAKLAVSGGTSPFTWSISGLPRNLTYSTSTGEITGTPVVSGTFPITVYVVDSNDLTGSAVFTLTVTQPAPPPVVTAA